MTDLHTHILPGMDDGAKNVEESIKLLQAQMDQGVTSVALTSHFYRDRENINSFLKRRESAWNRLQDAIAEQPESFREGLPELSLGAEVAFSPNIDTWDSLDRLCYRDTKYLLLELPFTPWNDRIFSQIFSIMDRNGIVPVIAHIDRYLKHQKKGDIQELLNLNMPVQVSARALLHFSTRGSSLRILRSCTTPLLISDCHSSTSRPVNIREGMEVVGKKLGSRFARTLERSCDGLLNEAGE